MRRATNNRTDRVLVTGARLPVGIEQVRKLGRTGHWVLASDSFASAPGMHSKHADDAVVTASPREATPRFVNDVVDLVEVNGVDRVMPVFEEVFYLAQHRALIEPHAELFAPSLDVLERLHNKATLRELAAEIGVPVPQTALATDRESLRAACAEHERFFARPAYSRGGVTLYTNHGPLAGAITLEELEPSEDNPFLVQPFVEGRDVCSYSICQHGRVAAHATYIHPVTLEHAGGIVFESIESDETLAIAQRVAEATGYHGQLSFDYMETERGEMVLIECNPRPTSGISVMPDEMFGRGVAGHDGPALIAPAGVTRQLSLALMRNIVTHWEEIPKNLSALLSGAPDIYADPDDMAPLLYQLLAYGRVLRYRLREGGSSRSDLMQGYFEDLTWDGEAA